MTVGHGLDPCTKKIQHVIVSDIPNRPHINGRRIVIIDTPGIDTVYAVDQKRMAGWLASS